MKISKKDLKMLIENYVSEGWADQVNSNYADGMRDSLKGAGFKEDNMWDMNSHYKAADTFHAHLQQGYDYETDMNGDDVQIDEEVETPKGEVSIVPCPNGLTVLIGKNGAPDLLVPKYSKKSTREPKVLSSQEKAVVAFIEKYGKKFKTDNERLRVEKSGLTPYTKLSVNGYSICFVP